MTFEAILYEVKDATALITLNRPEKMNAWSQVMADNLTEAMVTANEDDAVRAVVITGAGRAFCAGADLERGGDTFSGREERVRRETPVYPNEIGKPVIAAINGPAVGIGMTYPLLCDIRIAAEDAKMGFVFTRRGMIPELASHLLLQRVIGFSNAADLLMSGRIIRGAEAKALGLASQSLPKEEVLDAALAVAAEYKSAAPASVALTKKLLWEGLSASMPDMLKRENKLFAWAGNQADAKEGVMSFVEKRQPEWKLTAQDAPE